MIQLVVRFPILAAYGMGLELRCGMRDTLIIGDIKNGKYLDPL